MKRDYDFDAMFIFGVFVILLCCLLSGCTYASKHSVALSAKKAKALGYGDLNDGDAKLLMVRQFSLFCKEQ